MSAPLVSVIVVTYNQEATVRQALESALGQDWPRLEVVVFDDCSTDGTWDEIQRVARAHRGPANLVVHRQPRNVGPTLNLNDARARAQGQWHVKNDGDDVSLPGRVRRLVTEGMARGVGLVSSNAFLIDGAGARRGLYRELGEDRLITADQILQAGWQWEMLGATFAYRHELVQVFGALDPNLLYSGGDHIWPVRAGLLFPAGMLYVAEPLMEYRQHAGQLTRKVGDRTQPGAVLHETMTGHNVTATIQLLRDLLHLQKLVADPAQVERRKGILLGRLVREVEGWTRIRSTLLNAGLRPTWVASAKLDEVEVPDAFPPVLLEE